MIDLIIPVDGTSNSQTRVEYMNKIRGVSSQISSVQNSESKINRKMDRSESIKRAEQMLS
jgi:hypothetical protein